MEREIRKPAYRQHQCEQTGQEHLLPVQDKGRSLPRSLLVRDEAAGDEDIGTTQGDRGTEGYHQEGVWCVGVVCWCVCVWCAGVVHIW